jgi:hypothetical protein
MVAVAVIAPGASAFQGASDEGSPRGSELTLHLRFTVAKDLPALTRLSLAREAEAIWRREGVRLKWFSPVDDPVPTGLVLPVVVGHLGVRIGENDAWPVGRLLPDQSGGRLALASITAAQRVLAVAGYETESPGIGEHRLGLVLGRAVAHEIGHFLLGTNGHARHGLMRARIDARDFADLRDGTFFLDEVAGRWIRQELARRAISDVALARFAY